MTKNAVLSLQNVERVFPGFPPVTAVSGVSFSLMSGAFAALVGPSGSGKTTLLNLAAGLDTPTSGDVYIDGQKLSTLTRHERAAFRREKIGFVFQSYNLFPALSALENVEFTSVIRGDPERVRRTRAIQALEQVGLGGKLHSFPDQLSGGQQQRVAVARALASEPSIVFADEPTANLDSKTAVELIELFQRLNAEFGVTFLFSTHDHRLVERIQMSFLMKDGCLLESVTHPNAAPFATSAALKDPARSHNDLQR